MTPVMLRIWTALCAGRQPRDVALRLAVALSVTVALWGFASLFLVIEPHA